MGTFCNDLINIKGMRDYYFKCIPILSHKKKIRNEITTTKLELHHDESCTELNIHSKEPLTRN